MKVKLLAFAVFTTALIVSALLFGGDTAQGSGKPFRFKVIYINEIGSKGEKALIRARATKTRVAEVQRGLAADRTLTNKLRARGIQIKNIVGRDTAMDGSVIFYVR